MGYYWMERAEEVVVEYRRLVKLRTLHRNSPVDVSVTEYTETNEELMTVEQELIRVVAAGLRFLDANG